MDFGIPKNEDGALPPGLRMLHSIPLDFRATEQMVDSPQREGGVIRSTKTICTEWHTLQNTMLISILRLSAELRKEGGGERHRKRNESRN